MQLGANYKAVGADGGGDIMSGHNSQTRTSDSWYFLEVSLRKYKNQ